MTSTVKPTGDSRVAYIDCYRFDFPASDPASPSHYQTVMKPVFEFEIPPFAKAAPFFASAEIYALPDVTVSRSTTSACRFTRTIKSIAQSATDQVLAVCYTSGHFTLEAGGITQRVEVGDLAFIDLSQEVTIEAPKVENISLAISRRELEAILPFLDDAHCFVRRRGPLTKVLLGMMEQVIAIGPSIPAVDARPIAAGIIQLTAACLDTQSRQQVETSSGSGTVSLVSIKAAIGRRLTDPELSPQTLLDEFGIARSTLYRLFEPLGGVSAYITARRLHYAFRLMADPRQSRQRISQLALKLGFSHSSAFTRAFKELFGVSPTEVRALALAAQSKEPEIQLLVAPEVLRYLSPITRAPD